MGDVKYGIRIPGRYWPSGLIDVISNNFGGGFYGYTPSPNPRAVTSPHIVHDTDDDAVALFIHNGTEWLKFMLKTSGDALVEALGRAGFYTEDVVEIIEDVTMVTPAVKGRGMVVIGASVSDGDKITLGTKVYEFDTSADPGDIEEGNIRVGVESAQTPTAAGAALAEAINATEDFYEATVIDTGIVLIAGSDPGDVDDALTATFNSGSNMVSAVDDKIYGGSSPGTRSIFSFAIVPTAGEVAAGMIVLPLDPLPGNVFVEVRNKATFAKVAWDGKAVIDDAKEVLIIDNSGSTDWSASDKVHVIAIAD